LASVDADSAFATALCTNVGNQEQGAMGGPVIPGPMILELIRPLGAARGEPEARILASRNRFRNLGRSKATGVETLCRKQRIVWEC
jgi:hypothetical protein